MHEKRLPVFLNGVELDDMPRLDFNLESRT